MDYNKQIDILEKELKKIKKSKEQFDSLTKPQQIAEVLHDCDCKLDHTDQCSWGYESWVTPGTKRQYYHKKALRIIAYIGDKLEVTDILKVVNLVYED